MSLTALASYCKVKGYNYHGAVRIVGAILVVRVCSLERMAVTNIKELLNLRQRVVREIETLFKHYHSPTNCHRLVFFVGES